MRGEDGNGRQRKSNTGKTRRKERKGRQGKWLVERQMMMIRFWHLKFPKLKAWLLTSEKKEFPPLQILAMAKGKKIKVKEYLVVPW